MIILGITGPTGSGKTLAYLLPLVLDKAASCALDFVTQGYTYCMNNYNGPVEK